MRYKWTPTIQELLVVSIVWGSCAVVAVRPVHGFESQVQHLLVNEMLTRDEVANLSAVFRDLEATLRTRWPGSEVFPLGSFVTGLASKSSDADCMVAVPHHDVTADRLLVTQAAHLLEMHPNIYSDVRPKVKANRRIPLLKFTYLPTKRNCDVNFISNMGLQNSRMMAYYFSLDDKFLSLAAILKFWSKVQGLRHTESLASNTLNLLIIFYLQQENLAPAFFLLQRHLIRCPANHWETTFKSIIYNITSTTGVYEMLGGFFKYYSEFNFDDFVVSPLVGRPILKKQFVDIDSLPKELSLYKNYAKTLGYKPFRSDTKMCVQDVIEQRRNTADVAERKALYFISLVKFAAKMFEVMPKDVFLRVILTKHSRPCRIMLSKCRINEIRRLNICFNGTVPYRTYLCMNNKLF